MSLMITSEPTAIQRHTGRRPLASFDNSDGYLEMLQWTTAKGRLATRLPFRAECVEGGLEGNAGREPVETSALRQA